MEQDHADELSLADHLQHSDHNASKADLTVLFQIIFSPLAAKANEAFVQAVSADPKSFQKGMLNNNLKGHTISHLQLCVSVHEHIHQEPLNVQSSSMLYKQAQQTVSIVSMSEIEVRTC